MCPFPFHGEGSHDRSSISMHLFQSAWEKNRQLSHALNHLNQHFSDCAAPYPCPPGSRAGARDVTWPPLFHFPVPQVNSLLHYKVQRKINPTMITCHLLCIYFKLKANSFIPLVWDAESILTCQMSCKFLHVLICFF